MSSPLPSSLRKSIKDAARGRGGLIRCAHCLEYFTDDEIQIDHITPEGLGGSHDPVNLQCLCAPKAGAGCHRIKTAAEAKARAAAKRRAASRDADRVRLAAALACAVAAGVIGVSIATDTPLRRALDLTAHGMTLGLVLGSVAFLACVVISGVRRARSETEVPAGARGGEITDKIRTALVDVLGEDITAAAKHAGRVEYAIVSYGSGIMDHDDSLRAKVLERLNAKMGGRWAATWETSQSRVTFRPAPTFPKMIRHPGVPSERPWHLIPIADGVDIDLMVTSHALIIGRPNAGKTSLMRSIAVALAHASVNHGIEAIFADPKRIELIGFEDWPGVRGVIADDQGLWDMPLRLQAEVDARTKAINDRSKTLAEFSPLVVVIDEYEEYVARMHDMWSAVDPKTGKPRRKTGERIPPPVAAMASVLRLARRLKVHVIIGTQRPDAAWFGGAARDCMECRIVVGSPSVEALRMAYGRSDVGRDLPVEAKGRFTYQSKDRDICEAQGWWVPDPADVDGTNKPEDQRHLDFLRPAA